MEKKPFILGYIDSNSDELTEFKTTAEADYETEEWCVVEALTLDEAKANYEETFLKLKEKLEVPRKRK